MKIVVFSQISQKFVPMGFIVTMALRRKGDKPLSEPMIGLYASFGLDELTRYGPYTYVNWIIIALNNGLAPNRHQAII